MVKKSKFKTFLHIPTKTQKINILHKHISLCFSLLGAFCRGGVLSYTPYYQYREVPYHSTCKLRELFSQFFIINIIIQAFNVKVGSLVHVSVSNLSFNAVCLFAFWYNNIIIQAFDVKVGFLLSVDSVKFVF